MNGIIVVKSNIPNKNLELLKKLHPKSLIIKEGGCDKIIYVKSNATEEQLKDVKKLYPNAKIIIEDINYDKNKQRN